MNICKNAKHTIIGCSLYLFLSAGSALIANASEAAMDPQQLVKETSEQVLAALTERRDELKQDKSRIYEFVEEYLLPHFDNRYIARSVLGKHWRRASPEERERFMEVFQEMLIRSYASSMLEYSDQEISYLPYEKPGNADETVVETEIELAAGPVSVDYSLHKKDGRWLVYDVTIDGISMLVNYRSNINSELQRLDGVGSLIEKIEERNQQASADE